MESNLPKKRRCIKEKDNNKVAKPTKRIYIPIGKNEYQDIQYNHELFRQKLDSYIKEYPEIFPRDIKDGYTFHDIRESKKIPSLRFRRIRVRNTKEVFMILPSFVMPYMVGETEDLEKPLFLRQFGVPYWALTHVFGKNDMYWYRLENHIGRNSVVGTTIRSKCKLPQNLIADEKFSRESRERVYIAMTSSDDCVLGSSIVNSADHLGILSAYTPFQKEAKNISEDYLPQTVTTDGWKATQWSWHRLFPTINVLLCFLHSFIKIRDACKGLKSYNHIAESVWKIYHSSSINDFINGITELYSWSIKNLKSKKALSSIKKMYKKRSFFTIAYYFKGSYRTTANLDRLMDRLDRFLYSCKYFHGHKLSSERSVRAWAIMHNFLPYCSRYKKSYMSPVHKANGFVYHNSWLQNLLVASSLGGFRQ